MDPADVIRLVIGHEEPEESGYSPARRCVLALAGREGTSDHREKRAIDQSIAIDQKKSRAVRTFHRVNIKLAELDSYLARRELSAKNSVSLGLVSFHLPISS